MSCDVIFDYYGIPTLIQCKKSDKMKNIIERYMKKTELDKTKDHYYLYNGKKINIDLKYEETINEIDKKRKKMKILVIEESKEESSIIINENIKELNEIICPKCGENILIKMEDYKINLYKCKNNHNIDNILINELNNILKIDINKIVCNKCKENNKGNTYNNDFYKCITCNNNLCPLCKFRHDKNHIIIEYDKRNVICNKHNDFYVKYCNECNKNICFKCEREHKNHNKIDYGNIMPNNENNNELNEYINKLENIIIYK